MTTTRRSAVEIARSVAAGDDSATEVVTAALQSIAAAEQLNAFTRTLDEAALTRAGVVDRAVAEGHDPGPLAGVPVALKDIVDQQGIPTTSGSSFLRDPAEADAPIVTRLEAAGAVIVGRTGLHEFAFGFSSENDWWGPVRNPWDPTTSPGGSSGGSAVAVAAGMTPVGVGSDTGGSVRVPAAMCGCFGLKVTHGRIPLTGVFPLAASLDTVGPITTTVADAAAMYKALAGDDPTDPWSAPRPVESVPVGVDPGEIKIAIPHPWVDRPLDLAQQSGLATFRQALTSMGVTLVDVEIPTLDPSLMPRASYAEVAAVHRDWFTDAPERYGPDIRERLAADLQHRPDEIAAAAAWRAGLRHTALRALGEADFLLTPSVAALRKDIGSETVDAGRGPEPYRPALSWFTTLVNQVGAPAMALPVSGVETPGPPPSMQLVGRHWAESALLAFASELERRSVVGSPSPPDPEEAR